MTLDKVVIDVGKREFSSGLTFVACFRVRRLKDLLFVPPFSFHWLTNMSKSNRLKERLQEDIRLESMSSRLHTCNEVMPATKIMPALVASNQAAEQPDLKKQD